MTRGTTPDIIATVRGIDLNTIDELYATIKQGDTVVEKTRDEVLFEPPHLHIYLTQEETLQFAAGREYGIQLRGTTYDGEVFATNIDGLPVFPILKEGVI